MSVREIIDGHQVDIVEGENAWIGIATKKKYTNLTSCTAVRTSLAAEEPFPSESVSEDSHTWVRYAAHPGKFVFIRDIKGGYRICSNVASRSRSNNANFYKKMFEVDSAGFEEAVKIARRYGTMGGLDENDIRTAFYVRLALSLLHGESVKYCKKSLDKALGDLSDAEPPIRAEILSFGFKRGLPRQADLVADVRFLPNPFYIENLCRHCGLDEDVRSFVMDHPTTQEFMRRYTELLDFLIPHYREEGKRRLVIAIGCTGGAHRSVAIAEAIGQYLREKGLPTEINHRDLLLEQARWTTPVEEE